MFVIDPIDVVDAVLTDSSLAEDDYDPWDAGTPYAVGDRVIVTTMTLPKRPIETWAEGQDVYWNAPVGAATTTVMAGWRIGTAAAAALKPDISGSVNVHAVYEARSPSTNKKPPANRYHATLAPLGQWLRVGATNKWKAFDDVVSDPARGSSPITYELTVPSTVTGIAFFNLSATSVTVTVRDLEGEVVYGSTVSLVGTSGVTNWLEYFLWTPGAGGGDGLLTEAIFTDLPAYAGYTIEISIEGTQVGEIVLGRVITLGIAESGTEIGFVDFSNTATDDFGVTDLVRRGAADSVTFRFRVRENDAGRVRRQVLDLRARPTAWFASASRLALGATIFGFPADGLRLPLEAAGYHGATLDIQGLL